MVIVTFLGCVPLALYQNDIIVFFFFGFIGDKIRKLIERCNLYRARSGQLFFHIPDHTFRQFPTIRGDYAFPVFCGCFFRIKIYDRQAGHFGDIRTMSVQFLPKHILQIRGWICTYQ